jgi:hypothetical protein
MRMLRDTALGVHPGQASVGCPRRRLGISAVLSLAALGPGLSVAQVPPVLQLQYSADAGGNIVGAARYAARNDYVIDDTAGIRARIPIAGLDDRVDLRDFQIDTNGDLLFTTDIGSRLGGTWFAAGDVIARRNGLYSKAFDSAAAGVPAGVGCDGVARSGAAGNLLLSFDRTFVVGAFTIRPADVIAFNGSGFGAKVVDARVLGLPDNANIDAIDSIATSTDLLLSFEGAGSVGGLPYADEDILQLHLATSAWSLRFELLANAARWGPLNLDGLATAPNGDVAFKDGFE